ncbi:hypothetical protein BGZ54_002230 [Gamsiella multidivaricata]|nr:hypothetical protein BGZ54_002230 [Gamsiella multidivaricata]
MKYLRYYHTLAVVVIITLTNSLSSTPTAAAVALPLGSGAPQGTRRTEAAVIGNSRSLHKRQSKPTVATPLDPSEATTKHPPPAKTTEDPTPAPPASAPPSTTQKPEPTHQPSSSSPPPPSPPPAQTTTQAKPPPAPTTVHPTTAPATKPSSTHVVTTAASDTTVLPITGTDTSSAAPSESPTSPDNSNGVPTKVSQKVFIGIGVFGGMIVFALGGVAFCRHRRKKTLAAALLEQTAQFNHNNPYAKMSETNITAKENMPMTLTKSLGTYSVVSTYMPALADEIELGHGDSVTILQEYDDGWCLGVNNTRNGIQGVFPRHCLEGYYGANSGGYGGGPGYYPPNAGFKPTTNKRMSSMPQGGGWQNGPGARYNGGPGYGNYPPPNPNMHYNEQGYYNNGYNGGY